MKGNVEKILNFVRNFRVVKQELVFSYQEGYLGKNVYRVTLEDGSSRVCEQILKNGCNGDAVVILPITVDGDYLMIVESRPNVCEGAALEFPAGMVDCGESFLEAAKRELLEETGYEASFMQELEWHYQDQGCSKAIIRTYVALGCKKVQEKSLDESEKIETVLLTKDELDNLVNQSDYVHDANTKIAYMNYTLKKRGMLK